MAYEPTLTAVTPTLGGPSVSCTFTSFAGGTAYVNLFRAAGGRTMPVRGGVLAPVSGAAGFLDPEVPFGILSSYFAEMLDSDQNSLGYTGPGSITATSDRTWIHNPLDPQGALAVRTASATAGQVPGQMTSSIYYPVGRAAGIAITGPRRGIGSVQLAVYTDTFAAADTLDAMFGALSGDLSLAPILCVRFAGQFKVRLPRPLFVAVPSPTQEPVNALAGGEKILWDLSGTEVDPPSAALAEGLLTRADLDVYYSTHLARDSAYPSRLAMDTDYNLAGYAG